MEKHAKKRIGRPPGRKAPHRPTVSARVPAALYSQIKETARANNRTMAEEVFWRVNMSYYWEKTFGDTNGLAAEIKKAAQTELEAGMRAAGYTRVEGVSGAAWFEPGLNGIAWIVDNKPRGMDVLEEVVKRAIKAAREEERS
jgi:hypothetical protein